MSVYRIARVLAVIVVATGLAATTVGVIAAAADSKAYYGGALDTARILEQFQPGSDKERWERGGFQYLSSARGEVTKPRASGDEVAAWAFGALAPWLFAALALALLWPILRAAERGDPFLEDAADRLGLIGWLLLIGTPVYLGYEWLAAEYLSGGTGVSPGVSPSLTVSLWHFLPGVLTLVIAGIFRRGAELSEFERHAI